MPHHRHLRIIQSKQKNSNWLISDSTILFLLFLYNLYKYYHDFFYAMYFFSEYNIYKPTKTLRFDLNKNKQLECRKVEKTHNRKFSSVETFLRNVFLPEGYPDSVSDDYLSYQMWDTVQAFASSISGSLATQAVLEVVHYNCHNTASNACSILNFW